MEQKNTDKKFEQQPGKKAEVASGPSTTRPEIDLPLKGGRSDADLANKSQPKREDKPTERSDSDKKSVR